MIHFLVDSFQYSFFLALHDLHDFAFAPDVVLSGQVAQVVPFQYVPARQPPQVEPFQNGVDLPHFMQVVPFQLYPFLHVLLVVVDVVVS